MPMPAALLALAVLSLVPASASAKVLWLCKPGGEAVAASMLHVDGDEAWWRWVD